MKLLYLALAMLLATSTESFAQSTNAFDTIRTKGIELFTNVKTVVFILGGFGLVGLAVGAIFGSVKWKWFASLAVGLGTLAIASSIISYFTDDSTTTANFGDTLGNSGSGAQGG